MATLSTKVFRYIIISMRDECLICDRIALIKNNSNPYFVKELETGYVVLGDYQFYNGYTLFLCKNHADELHNLDHNYRDTFLHEMALVAESVYKAFKPNKLNYELLGNTDRHLHWHIFPRYTNDPLPNTATWVVDKKIRYDEKHKPTQEKLSKLKQDLLLVLDELLSTFS